MIYSNIALSLLLAGLGQQAEGFHLGKPLLCKSTTSSRHNPIYISPTEDAVVDSEYVEPMITVRFINTVGGKDVVTVVEQGSNLLFIGDQAGVKLPRSCRTGLCASCTCEVQDPQAVATASNPRDGYATIRACSTKCYVPPGMEEMIVDVYRMQLNKKVVRRSGEGTTVVEVEKEAYVNPMARFDDNWENEFKPSWETSVTTNPTKNTGSPSENRVCSNCGGSGKVECYGCDGRGTIVMGSPLGDKTVSCQLCVGKCTAGCGSCRGTGTAFKMKSY